MPTTCTDPTRADPFCRMGGWWSKVKNVQTREFSYVMFISDHTIFSAVDYTLVTTASRLAFKLGALCCKVETHIQVSFPEHGPISILEVWQSYQDRPRLVRWHAQKLHDFDQHAVARLVTRYKGTLPCTHLNIHASHTPNIDLLRICCVLKEDLGRLVPRCAHIQCVAALICVCVCVCVCDRCGT